MLLRLVVIALLFLPPAAGATRQTPDPPTNGPLHSAIRSPQSAILKLAVLDFGEAEAGRRAADRVAGLLPQAAGAAGVRLSLIDRGLSRAAARGVGYRGSLNLSRREARDLGAAVGCDFLVTGDAQTLRRSPSERAAYFESYASVFVVSARTGRLVLWERPAAEGATPEQAEAALAALLDARAAARYLSAAAEAHAREEREPPEPAAPTGGAAPLDFSSEEGAGPGEGVREPAPFRRLRPAYTEAAARAEAEATVDALVELDETGAVVRVDIERWAGFGLDEAVAAAVRGMHFRPAERDGRPVPSRVLLRYNFRRPPPEKK
ncbi:MAG TPA: TonB family protein [Pyrinomonadaceae bacterium]|nr:TonB family protein [Pyrinomonadaceae bacterium]